MNDIDAKVAEINALVKTLFRAVYPQRDLRLALEADLKRTKRLPTKEECRTMLEQGGDDAENYEHPKNLKKDFPATLSELECAWQIRGMDLGNK